MIQIINDGIALLANQDFKIGSWTLTVRQEWKLIIVGAAIIVAVAVDRLSEAWRARRLARMGARH